MTNEPTPLPTAATTPSGDAASTDASVRPAPPKSISAREWIDLLFDEGSFDERFAAVRTPDPLKFSDSQPYPERLAETREQTGGREAVWTGSARLGGQNVIVAVSDFRFIGGSMGFAVGERVDAALRRQVHSLHSGTPWVVGAP